MASLFRQPKKKTVRASKVRSRGDELGRIKVGVEIKC